MPLPPMFAISGLGGVSLAVTVLVVRRIVRNPRKKRKPSLQVVRASTADVSSTIDSLVISDSFVQNCGSKFLACTSNAETPCSVDSISARSAAVIQSHQVTASASLLPKSISALSSVSYDSKVCVDTYAALLTNDGDDDDVVIDDDDKGVYDDAKTCTDDLESEAQNRMNDLVFDHGETDEDITELNPNTLVLIDTPLSKEAVEPDTPSVLGEYEQSDELLVEPKSPILGQQISPGALEDETPFTLNSEPSFVTYHMDYDADLGARAAPESDDAPVPSIFTESATVSHEVEHHSEQQGSAVLILHSPEKSLRTRAPVFVTAAPLASVPALEDVVTGTPIPTTEIRIGAEQLDITSETPESQDNNQMSTQDEQQRTEDDSKTTDEESDMPQEMFMSDHQTIPEEKELHDNESDDVVRDSSNTLTVSLPRFKQLVCDSHVPVLPMVSRERSTLSSPDRTSSGSPAATRPFCEKDVEHVRALTNYEAADDSEKENTFQSTSTSPERLSRKPWRSERLGNVFARKASMRRLRIPDRIRRRQSQKHNTKNVQK